MPTTTPSTRIVPPAPVILVTDAGCDPNPGGDAYGAYIIHQHPTVPGLEREIVGSCYYGAGVGTSSNLAEYWSALDGLATLWRLPYRGDVILRTDSRLIVNQFAGAWGCYSPALQAQLARLCRAAACFASLTVEWIPRTANERAHHLARRAFESRGSRRRTA